MMKTRKQFFLLINFICCVTALQAQQFYLGGDLSYVNELEDNGAIFYNDEGNEQDVYKLLAEKGQNLVRLRLWHNPQWTNYSNLPDVIKSIERAKNSNQSILLDFHYSDFWADPSRQWRPEAWNGITNDSILADSVYNYTYATLKTLAGKNLLPELVQIGNETNGNMLIERSSEDIDGNSPDMYPINWERMSLIMHQGINAVKKINEEFASQIKTVIHVAQPENASWWFNDAVSKGLQGFDIIGFSYYPQWSDYNIREVGDIVKHFKDTYQKEVMIVEVGYPWTTAGSDNAGNVIGNGSKEEVYNNTISDDVQRDFMIELSYLVKENGGSGVIYWEPAWVSSEAETFWGKGSHYENAALFDFDNKINSGADYLSYDYSQTPEALMDKNVTFRVNMQGKGVQDGVFVTGSFTGAEWEFVEMIDDGDDWYTVNTKIPGRSIGAYIFYNNDDWNDSNREEVPSSCAKMWDTHRKYVISDIDKEYSYVWSTCSDTPLNIQNDNQGIRIFPIPAESYLELSGIDQLSAIEIINLLGQSQKCQIMDKRIDISNLIEGVYLISISTKTGTITQQFVKK